ncbi:MAG: hypothetical protein ACLR0W_01825, partial [Lachnospira sp.]
RRFHMKMRGRKQRLKSNYWMNNNFVYKILERRSKYETQKSILAMVVVLFDNTQCIFTIPAMAASNRQHLKLKK